MSRFLVYPEMNPATALKALSYFGEVLRLPLNVQHDLQIAALRVRELPQMSKLHKLLLPDLKFPENEPS